MSTTASTPTPITEPSRSGRLLNLVRKLIDYGRELAATIRQRTATEPVFALSCFGTIDLAVIFERIARGVQLANMLEARVLQRAAQLDAGPRRGRARSAAKAPAAPAAEPTDPHLASLPTPEEIAAEVRRRPIGVVIGDICRDLGILPSHPLWREVQQLMLEYGGSFARLTIHMLRQTFLGGQSPTEFVRAAMRRLALPLQPQGGTGPP
jgi:hypothetical protein